MAVPAEVANVALATVPVTLAPVNELNPEPLPLMFAPVMLPVAEIKPPVLTLPPSTFPVTVTLVNVPTLVMLGCAFVVTVAAVVAVVALPADVANVALATVPVTLAPVNELNPEPLPFMLPPVMLPIAVINPAVS